MIYLQRKLLVMITDDASKVPVGCQKDVIYQVVGYQTRKRKDDQGLMREEISVFIILNKDHHLAYVYPSNARISIDPAGGEPVAT